MPTVSAGKAQVEFLGEMPKCLNVLCYWDRLRPVRSFDTKSALRISRKLFDLVSPNFTQTSTLTFSTASPDMTSLSASGLKL